MQNLKSFMHNLGYFFKNEALLCAAITHRSMGINNNERLEFLGDAILNFTIGAELFKRFPEAREGVLTRLRAQLVRGEMIAELAKELRLSDYLRLGMGELKSGGHQRTSILADALEAIIGAIYIDSDINICNACIVRWYESRLETIILNASSKDPKTELQEWMQAKHYPLPEYRVLNIAGDTQNPLFTVACSVSVLADPVEAVASSRRQAEQLAAESILKVLYV
jgi:ribonuclease-3